MTHIVVVVYQTELAPSMDSAYCSHLQPSSTNSTVLKRASIFRMKNDMLLALWSVTVYITTVCPYDFDLRYSGSSNSAHTQYMLASGTLIRV